MVPLLADSVVKVVPLVSAMVPLAFGNEIALSAVAVPVSVVRSVSTPN